MVSFARSTGLLARSPGLLPALLPAIKTDQPSALPPTRGLPPGRFNSLTYQTLSPAKVLFVSSSDHVFALDKHKGLELWRTSFPGPTSSRNVSVFPTPSGTHLCCRFSDRLFILDPRTGAIQAKRKLGLLLHDVQILHVPVCAAPDEGDHASLPDYAQFREMIGPSLLYEDDMLFTAKAGVVDAMDSFTGTKIWERKFHGIGEWDMILATLSTRANSIPGRPGPSYENVLGVGINGQILTLNKHTSVEMWRHKLNGLKQRHVALAPSGKGLYALSDGHVETIALEYVNSDGRKEIFRIPDSTWTMTFLCPLITAPAPLPPGHIHSLSTSDPEKDLWKLKVSGAHPDTSDMMLDGSTLFVGIEGKVLAIDVANGNVKWKNGPPRCGYDIGTLATPLGGTAYGWNRSSLVALFHSARYADKRGAGARNSAAAAMAGGCRGAS
ncbi:hypothetical protein BDK51DRAFT_46459 [Blyttiomyces helicus]|uniref:Pyrrolo-quinoline quinone repeat domain-containing protein n=1 Tax=Blyttiomyces helicus TaxID=388810 RepID=A0A4P9WJ26_9FUNG|nr:hypothetical protein BDK51DRAFT_46459 [Blyttiomyces helicus]|eukprot:RKO90596.1 hypothetical protein BDK51DRAFT_46459 [Blyttiomyces helicus]